MVICHSHNFLFLRLPKNASSSIAEYMVKNYCDQSVDQWTTVNDAGIKNNNVPQSLQTKYKVHTRWIHLMLQEVIDNDVITEDKAIQLNKYAVIRDPLERQLSLFFFLMRNRRAVATPQEFRKQFAQGKHESDTNNCNLQSDFMKINGKIYDNTYYWLYDNLNDCISTFTKSIDKPIVWDLQQRKSGIKPKNNNLINEFYDTATRRAVEEYYAADFELYEKLVNETN